MSDRHVAVFIVVPIRRRLVSAAHDHSVAIAHTRVTRRAVHREAQLPALQVFFRDGEREHRSILSVDLASVEIRIGIAVGKIVRHRSLDRRPLAAAVGKETRWTQRDVLWLVVHVLPAACDCQCRSRERQHRYCAQRINTAPPTHYSAASLPETFAYSRDRTARRRSPGTGRTCRATRSRTP